MTTAPPSSGLEAILGIMESEAEGDGIPHIFDTIHFSSTKLHGNFHTYDELNRSIGFNDRNISFTLSSPFLTTKSSLEGLTPNAQLGIALGQAIVGLPVNIYPGMPSEMEELIGSYKPKTIFCFGPNRKNFDLDRLQRSDIIQRP